MNHPVKVKYVLLAAALWLAWIAWSDHQLLKQAVQHVEQLHDALQALYQH